MIQASNKIGILSRLATVVFSNSKPQMPQLLQNYDNASHTTKTIAHRQAVSRIREVQAEYQIRGWMR